MSPSRAPPSPSRLRNFLASFRDEGVDNELLWHLTGIVYGDRASLYASVTMGTAATLAAWGMTKGTVFLAIAVGHVVVGAARVNLLRKFTRVSASRAPEASARDLDREFSLWSTLFAFMLGMTFCGLASEPIGFNVLPLAFSGSVGFAIAFVTRNAARLRLLVYQVVAVTLPLICGLLVLPIPSGLYYAVLLAGLVVTTIILGRASNARIISHYWVNETNRRMARFDTLTGILNRFSFNDALTEALNDPRTESLILLTVDLDRFKEINDTLGHIAGDQVIVEAAARLKAVVKPGDVVARLGGDEFVVVVRDQRLASGELRRLAERVASALAKPIEVNATWQPMSGSIGVAVFPEHGVTAEELMKRADIALYDAKRLGRGRFAIFDVSMQRKLDDTRQVEIDLEAAIREDQFEAWLQPILDIERGVVIGYEALARWRHPTYGIIAPDRFIPIAEQTGAIVAIGLVIMEKACTLAARWDKSLSIAVNISPRQLRDPKSFVESTRYVLHATGLEPSRLFMELTESVMLEDTPDTREAIRQLADYGIHFSLDDFGSGYSSLAYIQTYPFSRIKIDRHFINRIDSDDVSAAIVASICLLAKRTRMDIVAEGVETPHQASILKELGISYAQGYLYGRPQPGVVSPAALERAL